MILVTGANGFIGSHLCADLALNFSLGVRKALRRNDSAFAEGNSVGNIVVVGDIGPETDWHEALRSIEIVVHLAAHVHQKHDKVKHAEVVDASPAQGIPPPAVALQALVHVILGVSQAVVHELQGTGAAEVLDGKDASKNPLQPVILALDGG